jgi:hypothetical protein
MRLVNWMAVLITNTRIALDTPALISAWNTMVADQFDEGLLWLSLVKQREMTNWDSVAMMNDIMQDIQVAGEGIRDYQAAAPLVCEIHGGTSKRDVSNTEFLDLLVRALTSLSCFHMNENLWANANLTFPSSRRMIAIIPRSYTNVTSILLPRAREEDPSDLAHKLSWQGSRLDISP